MSQKIVGFTIILGMFASSAFASTGVPLSASTNNQASSSTSINLAQQRVLLRNMEKREAMLESKHESAAAAMEAKRILVVKHAIASLQSKTRASANVGGVHVKSGIASGSGISLK
jgi:hypothetical protein